MDFSKKKIIVGRTLSGHDFIGELVGGMVEDVFKVEDQVSAEEGVFPMIKPWTTIMLARDDERRRKKYSFSVELVEEYHDIDQLVPAVGQSIVDIMKDCYKIGSEI